MRRASIVLVLVSSTAAARAKPRMQPPLERECLREMTAPELAACVDRHAHGATISALGADLRMVTTLGQGVYLYLQNRGKWHMVERLGDAHYAFVSVTPITVAKKPARQIELEHVLDLISPPPSWFRERVVLVCGEDCTQVVTACTVMSGGHATEIFIGQLAIDAAGQVTVTGDRSKINSLCLGR